MLLSVADLVASREFAEGGETQVSDIWNDIFTHLFEKCLHPHSEIRHSALHIFSLIFDNYGKYFTYEIWKFAFRNMYFEMFDNCLEVFLNLIRDKENKNYSIDTPKVVKELRQQFATKGTSGANSNLNMMAHHSTITIDKHWEETMIHIIRALTIISRKYLEQNYPVDQDPIAVKICESYLLLLRISKYEIFLEAIKGVIMIISASSNWNDDSVNRICEFLIAIGAWVDRKPENEKEFQFIRGKSVPVIINMLS